MLELPPYEPRPLPASAQGLMTQALKCPVCGLVSVSIFDLRQKQFFRFVPPSFRPPRFYDSYTYTRAIHFLLERTVQVG